MEQHVVLIVDDNLADVEMLSEAIAEVEPEVRIMSVYSGKDCLAALQREGEWEDSPRPDLILLDLNMPGIDGKGVLSRLKRDPKLCHIPVVVLTTSNLEKDVLDTHRLYANSFVSKPMGYENLKKLMEELLHYWLRIVRIPRVC